MKCPWEDSLDDIYYGLVDELVHHILAYSDGSVPLNPERVFILRNLISGLRAKDDKARELSLENARLYLSNFGRR